MLSCDPESENYYQNVELWYHGTTLESAQDIIQNGIDPFISIRQRAKRNQERRLDFGAAFYLTSSKAQAIDIAQQRSTFKHIPKAIIVAKVNCDFFKDNSCLDFDGMSLEWFNMFYKCRVEDYQEKEYSLVYGAVADGNTGVALQEFMKYNEFDKSKHKIELYHEVTRRKDIQDQLALTNQKICNELQKNISIERL